MAKKPLFKILPDSIVKSGENGYQYCATDPVHPRALKLSDRKVRYCYVHVVKMENSIGRLLHKGEEVHHKNGDQSDNRLSNLELTTSGEHQRDHALTDNKFWKKSPRTKPRKASVYNVVTQFLSETI